MTLTLMFVKFNLLICTRFFQVLTLQIILITVLRKIRGNNIVKSKGDYGWI